MATINLGAIKFNWQGAYAGGTAYVVDDVVSYNGSSYVCKLASTGNLPTNATYWDQMSSAGTNGTNGTDLGTTLTTQGDLVYRDGSGLQRLGAGTAGQVLQTGGAGANPSWGTLSSDAVKLASVATNTTHTTIDVNGYFDDTTYSHYKLVMHSIKPENNGGEITAKFMTSASTTQDGDNFLVLHTGFQSGSGASDGQQIRKYWNVNSFNDWEGTWTPKNTSSSNIDYCSMVATIINPQSTSQGKVVAYQWNTFSTTAGVMIISNGHMFSNTTAVMTGFRIYRDTGNAFLQSAWSLYGFKK
jgi:hypothetical protein